MRAGRPTKYTPELVEKAKHYLEHYAEYDDVIPSIVGLALVLDITRETIYKWAKEEGKETFTDILAKINIKQERVLIGKGLSNEFNSNIVKLVLGKHGYHDKQDTSLTGADGGPVKFEGIAVTFVDADSDSK